LFSRAQNRKNTRKTVRIDAGIIKAGRDSVEDYLVRRRRRGGSRFLAGWKPGRIQLKKSLEKLL